ncbi:helix-turn-helix domain-containing protein [Faecalimonas umbilicata]|uniref:helix-turn-helix domain-containing protein n=1 Tax=Faecalimonas umbilicata TaxID=1912855 RepID=UPI003994D53A
MPCPYRSDRTSGTEQKLNLNKSTVHRILNSLICMEYAKQDAETLKYSLTFKFCGIANQILKTE